MSAPLMCLAKRISTPPSNFPPTKTAGSGWRVSPESWQRAARMAEPEACRSSSMIVGPTARLKRRFLATVEKQQSEELNTTTALEEARWVTISRGVMFMNGVVDEIDEDSISIPDFITHIFVTNDYIHRED